MCGISVCLSSDTAFSAEYAKNSLNLLRHRGPDVSAVWQDEGIAIIHTRLSIQDLSEAGNQPMSSSNGRYIISFNGEIYNHLELRKRYLTEHRFRGHSDTETVIELFQIMGADCFSKMVGMWAVVIWDISAKELFISRDRYGQKPLYWAKIGRASCRERVCT